MKLFLFIILVPLLVNEAWNNNHPTGNLPVAITKRFRQVRPGEIATREGSWTMTATIDGKKWKATSMMPPAIGSRIMGAAGENYISFPFSPGYMKAGKKIKLTENYAADLGFDDEVAIYGGRTGEIEITKVTGDWVEAKFFFTASSARATKKILVTDGFTRFSMAKL
jgi:hypothetical protein